MPKRESDRGRPSGPQERLLEQTHHQETLHTDTVRRSSSPLRLMMLLNHCQHTSRHNQIKVDRNLMNWQQCHAEMRRSARVCSVVCVCSSCHAFLPSSCTIAPPFLDLPQKLMSTRTNTTVDLISEPILYRYLPWSVSSRYSLISLSCSSALLNSSWQQISDHAQPTAGRMGQILQVKAVAPESTSPQHLPNELLVNILLDVSDLRLFSIWVEIV